MKNILVVDNSTFSDFAAAVSVGEPVTVIPPPPEYPSDATVTVRINVIDATKFSVTIDSTAALSGDLLMRCEAIQRTGRTGGGYDIAPAFDFDVTLPLKTVLYSQIINHSFGGYVPGNSFLSVGVIALPNGALVGVTTVHPVPDLRP